jgi:hypothetical protein
VWWSIAVLFAAFVGLAGGAYVYIGHVESHLECQARYNETNNARSRALTEAGDKERVADRAEDKARADLFTHPAILKSTAERTAAEREEMRQLAVAWQRALTEEQKQQAAADVERAEHPVPPPPSEVCG